MALQYYFDTHIAKVVANQLRAKGVDVVRCEEVGMAEASDEEHLVYASKEGRIMVSQDDDFLTLDADWQQQNRSHTGIMYEPQHLQGVAQISHIVQQLLFYNEAETGGAIDYQTEIANHVIYL